MDIIVFSLENKEYAIEINSVYKIIQVQEITAVPDTLDFVEGVINIRDTVIPIINLRQKFLLEKKQLIKTNRIIILRVDSHFIGVIVDSVVDVFTVDPENITQPDELLKKAEYLTGVAKIEEKMVFIIDIKKLFSSKEQTSIKTVSKKKEE
jgi:purine-binding chemotaxis protein CheW